MLLFYVFFKISNTPLDLNASLSFFKRNHFSFTNLRIWFMKLLQTRVYVCRVDVSQFACVQRRRKCGRWKRYDKLVARMRLLSRKSSALHEITWRKKRWKSRGASKNCRTLAMCSHAAHQGLRELVLFYFIVRLRDPGKIPVKETTQCAPHLGASKHMTLRLFFFYGEWIFMPHLAIHSSFTRRNGHEWIRTTRRKTEWSKLAHIFPGHSWRAGIW